MYLPLWNSASYILFLLFTTGRGKKLVLRCQPFVSLYLRLLDDEEVIDTNDALLAVNFVKWIGNSVLAITAGGTRIA